jgi:hypothetical protein
MPPRTGSRRRSPSRPALRSSSTRSRTALSTGTAPRSSPRSSPTPPPRSPALSRTPSSSTAGARVAGARLQGRCDGGPARFSVRSARTISSCARSVSGSGMGSPADSAASSRTSGRRRCRWSSPRTAWEAIDLVARKLYAEDAQITLARARADAMMQLILGQTTATVHLHATTPEALPATALPTPTKTPAPTATGGIATTVTSAVGATAATGGMTTTLNRAVGATAAPAPSAVAIGEGRDSAGIAGCLPSAGLVEVGGFGGPGTTHLPAQWLATLAGPRERTDQGNGRSPRVVIAPALTCHRETGALLRGDLPAGLSRGKRLTRRQPVSGALPEPREVGYRIPAAMRRLVEVRDGRCRFPGCSVSIRFCDLDHVVPWPLGPTDPGNLICLCRRHHRLKQGRDGWQRWRPTLLPDGRVTWIDPVGRRHVTDPVDHLGATLPSIVPTNPRANVETLCSQGVAAEGAATVDVAAEGSAGEGLAVQPCSPRWDAFEYGLATDSVLEREFIRVLIDAGAYDPVRDRFIGPRPTRRAPDRTRGTRTPEVETQERTVTGAGTAAAYGLVVLADQQPPF